MMRWLFLAVLVIALSGAAAWVALTLPTSGSGLPLIPAGSENDGPYGLAVVEGDMVHNFGTMAQQSEGFHEWTIKNGGEGDLILTGGHPGCTCTILNLGEDKSITLKPGEAFHLKVKWATKLEHQGPYEKQAPIYVENDPGHQELVFTVRGRVQPAIVTYPSDPVIDTRSISNEQEHTYDLVLASPDRPEMKITNLTSSRPDLIALESRALNDDEKKRLPEIREGYLITITVKPTASLGAFREEVIIGTDHPKRPEYRLTIAGTLTGPISIVPSMVRLYNASGTRGETAEVTLWVLGHDRTRFEVTDQPKKLEVSIAPADERNGAADSARGHSYLLTVTVPPGTAPCVIDQPILLRTDHPRAAEVKVPVYIQVVGQ